MLAVSQGRKAVKFGRIALLAGLAVLGTGMNQAARAQDSIIGFTTGNSLFRFQSNTPGTVTNLGTITGITGTLLDIDLRPQNGLIYGLASNAGTFSLYTISISAGTVGQATLITALTGVTATATTYDIDFNPNANALRIVGSNGDNFRVAAAQIGAGLGMTLVDTQLTGGTGIIGVAYTNNTGVVGSQPTTLYDINTNGQLFLQGAVNGGTAGTPQSPNSGILTAVGTGTGVTATEAGFDISGFTGLPTGTAYLAANNTLYNLNLTTGTSSSLGAINTAGLSGTVRGITVVGAPEPGTLALVGTGLLSMGGITVRRRKSKKA